MFRHAPPRTVAPLLDDGFELTGVDTLFASGFVPFEKRWDGEGPMPLLRDLGGPRYPRLARIHPRRWAEVLVPLDAQVRHLAAAAQGMMVVEMNVAAAVLDQLPPPAQEIARKAIDAPTLDAVPGARRPARRQVNVRLGEREHEELVTAADIAGTTPTTLARWLLLAGTRRILHDHAAAYSEVRSRS